KLNQNIESFLYFYYFRPFFRNFSNSTLNDMPSSHIDKLDLRIINEMMQNASVSYADLGKKLLVSGGTIHVRMKKLHELGIIKGNKMQVNLEMIGYDVIAFVGIYLEKSSLYYS